MSGPFVTTEFWTAVLAVLTVLGGIFLPDYKDEIAEMAPSIAVIIVAFLVKAGVTQAAAFWRGYQWKDGRWVALSEQHASTSANPSKQS